MKVARDDKALTVRCEDGWKAAHEAMLQLEEIDLLEWVVPLPVALEQFGERCWNAELVIHALNGTRARRNAGLLLLFLLPPILVGGLFGDVLEPALGHVLAGLTQGCPAREASHLRITAPDSVFTTRCAFHRFMLRTPVVVGGRLAGCPPSFVEFTWNELGHLLGCHTASFLGSLYITKEKTLLIPPNTSCAKMYKKAEA